MSIFFTTIKMNCGARLDSAMKVVVTDEEAYEKALAHYMNIIPFIYPSVWTAERKETQRRNDAMLEIYIDLLYRC